MIVVRFFDVTKPANDIIGYGELVQKIRFSIICELCTIRNELMLIFAPFYSTLSRRCYDLM